MAEDRKHCLQWASFWSWFIWMGFQSVSVLPLKPNKVQTLALSCLTNWPSVPELLLLYAIKVTWFQHTMCVCVCEHVFAYMLNPVWLFASPGTVAPPGSSVHGISQTRILEWVAISQSRDETYNSCICRWVLDHWATQKVRCVIISSGFSLICRICASFQGFPNRVGPEPSSSSLKKK